MTMKIVCAQSLLHGEEAFGTVGDAVSVPDQDIGAHDLRDADALVTRSKTRIDGDLIADSRLEFVGTATAGFDHIDTELLDKFGIAWAAAPGCNAVSVAEYVIAGLLEIASRAGIVLEGKRMAVVGVGQVGGRVAERAAGIGMQVLLNDPPRAEREQNDELRTLAEILPEADIVTLHTPLTDDGPHPTRKMVGHDFFGLMKPGAIFVNASRGEVVDEPELLRAMDSGIVAQAILDVWENEPDCRRELLERVDIATPHIAGYSFDGKLRGTEMVYHSLCRHFGIEACWDSKPHLPPSPLPHYRIAGWQPDEAEMLTLIRNIYDIRRDDRAMRPAPLPDSSAHARLFKQLRRDYPVRREFCATEVKLPSSQARLAGKLTALGFCLAGGRPHS